MSGLPNFSGVWRADFSKSELEIEAPASTTFQMEHEEPHLRIKRTHSAKDYEDRFSLELTTDGQETVFRKGTLDIHIKCAWQGKSLSFCSRFLVGESEAENLVCYSLSADGRELVADERYSGPPKNYHNRWVLVRANDEGARGGGETEG